MKAKPADHVAVQSRSDIRRTINKLKSGDLNPSMRASLRNKLEKDLAGANMTLADFNVEPSEIYSQPN